MMFKKIKVINATKIKYIERLGSTQAPFLTSGKLDATKTTFKNAGKSFQHSAPDHPVIRDGPAIHFISPAKILCIQFKKKMIKLHGLKLNGPVIKCPS